ncbi:DNA-directed RNA polymerase subunit delta [Lentilactobacillus otakiensis]|uniref:Probable DNA-directed RNA polymerase subunit delta n=1 Tax=Lentilactobacillus otakiensis DSM 19908 = JCM 15040 TaxID=1423780 RepID=S4PQV2_9LACO|nr:DNA-directed RNA polymerase subunit delta [Lentilactobacillus otakiensis]KRL11825.1 DNA-directed RNA polymerase subunit delta [Lentilactobacillus otakiensis DSM 19908 = JCM 15040]MBZ3776054.1 DNA-directed RNA polymerase subunit delta [Lentilactobacillus otakiensis]MDV3519165.1 DNA-directed RNA polymerase subunit delta [Lentilactobacillus otakiensis]GAD17530.1 DNA-directed RNA polymerase subunit delta [Lentilactobacillus otakiensis DSM 19908 = JCM 15040]
MELEVFKGQNKNELSMIEVAHAILAQRGDTMPFADLANAVQAYLGDSNKEIRDRLSQFYTDLNIDGSFISLGDNLWGLRTWYPYESIDEATVHTEEDEDRPKRKKRRKVNAFLADASDDDDVIDYDDDDPEDQDDDDFDDDTDDDDDSDDESENLGKYNKDLQDIDDDSDDDDLPDGIEGQLNELNDDDDSLDDDDDDFNSKESH